MKLLAFIFEQLSYIQIFGRSILNINNVYFDNMVSQIYPSELQFKALQKNIFTDRSKAVLLLWLILVISVVCLLCFYARLFIVALWSPDWNGLTSWLSFVMYNCEFVTFALVSWVRCGT